MATRRGNTGSDMLSGNRNRRTTTQRQNGKQVQLRNWLILLGVLLAIVLVVVLLRGRKGKEITANRMPCYASQSVTPFGEHVIYYDGVSLHCLKSTGGVRWSFPIGQDAVFAVSDHHIAAWLGNQLYIINEDGRSTYSENLDRPIQFARVGDRYVAMVVGEDTTPTLVVKDLQGVQVDVEEDAFNGLMILDVGFYGDQGQYLWTLSLDVYGTAANTTLNTFQVGKMNTGVVSLGEPLTYHVLFEDNKLRVFTTQQMYTYDYKCVQDTNATMLVYGWQLIDEEIPAYGSASMLLAPTAQTTNSQEIKELRVLQGSSDRRYTLPSECVGAAIQNGNIYAFSKEYLYRADVGNQHFYGYVMPLPGGQEITAFYGLTKDGYALVASGDTVYSVSLPR